MSKVDIILPAYNCEKYIVEAIDSVVDQSYEDWKLIIIDDGSTDLTNDLIKNYLSDKRISLKRLKKNKGQGFCRNFALRYSKSKYVAFIDADDIWLKEKLKRQIDLMSDLNLSFTYTNYSSFREINGKKRINKNIVLPESFNFDQFIKNTSICTSAMIVEREKVGLARFLNISSCDDYLFKCKLLKNCNLAKKVGENLTLYRISSNSIQSSRIKNLYWVWHVNKHYNHLGLFKNILSVLYISINSIKKYGFK
jgi:teichuronic acid biosynthesis glycosyltransferase TuaG